MKYMIKGELEVKISGSELLPGECDFRIGAILTDDSMALLTGPTGTLPRLGGSKSPLFLPAATHTDWWHKCL